MSIPPRQTTTRFARINDLHARCISGRRGKIRHISLSSCNLFGSLRQTPISPHHRWIKYSGTATAKIRNNMFSGVSNHATTLTPTKCKIWNMHWSCTWTNSPYALMNIMELPWNTGNITSSATAKSSSPRCGGNSSHFIGRHTNSSQHPCHVCYGSLLSRKGGSGFLCGA